MTLIGVIGLSVFKNLLIFIIAFVFKRRDYFHIQNHFSFYQIIGVIFVPLFILSYFLGDFVVFNKSITMLETYTFFGLLALIILVIRELKSLFTALTKSISLFYIILYLCTLEILPIILLIKILNG